MTDNVSVTEWSYDRLKLATEGRLEVISDMVAWIVFSLINYHGQEAVSVEVDGVLYIIEKIDVLDEQTLVSIEESKKLLKSII